MLATAFRANRQAAPPSSALAAIQEEPTTIECQSSLWLTAINNPFAGISERDPSRKWMEALEGEQVDNNRLTHLANVYPLNYND